MQRIQKNLQLQAFIQFIKIGLLITLILLANSIAYAYLLNGNFDNVTLFTWPNALHDYLSQSPRKPLGIYLVIAGIIPSLIGVVTTIAYLIRGKEGVKTIFLALIILAVWSTASSTLFLSQAKEKFTLGLPLEYIQCWITYWSNNAITHELIMASIFGLLPIFLTLIIFLKNKPPNIYGDAHFATYAQTRVAGLLKEEGLILGRAWGRYLYMNGYEHVTLFAPTGSGKTVGFAVPNLFFWQGSCVVNDVKLELFNLTSKYRQLQGHTCYLWNPAAPDGNTHCYNPLDIISNNPYTRIDDIQKIAAILIHDNPKSEPIWQVQSRLLFVALVLYVMDTQGLEKTIGRVVRLVKESPNFSKFLLEVLSERCDLDPLCRNNFYKFCELHEKTRTSVLATFLAYFELFDNPLIEAATSKSDFDIRQLRKKRITIYVGITNDNLVRLSPLLTLFYQQVMDVMTRRIPTQEEHIGILLLMEEFAALRRMELLLKNIGLLRQYLIRVVIIIQELSQLYETYGKEGAKVFINAKVRIAYAQNDDGVKNYLSEEMGNKTMRVVNTSKQNKGGTSRSNQFVKRPLLLPQEIGTLPKNKALILVEGQSPIYAQKLQWSQEKRFKHLNLGPIKLPNILSEIKVHKVFEGIPILPETLDEDITHEENNNYVDSIF